MMGIEKFGKRFWAHPLRKRIVVALVPVLFFGLAGVVLMHRRGAVDHSLSPEESRRLADLSKSMLDQGQFAEALPPTLRLYEAYPGNHIYIGRLAQIYDRLGKYGEEAQYWEKYMDHAPSPIEACPQIGQAYWKQGEAFESRAVAAYQRCAAVDPTNTDSIFYLAHALEMTNQWSQAADEYKKGLTISPGYTDLTLGLARCWLRMGKPEEAKNLLLPVLNKPAVSSGALLVLGMYYIDQKNYPAAKRALVSGSQLADNDPDFHILLARVAEDTNDNAEALRQYSKLVQLNPQDVQARSRQHVLQAMQRAADTEEEQ